MGAVAVAMVSPRTIAFTLPSIVLGLVISHIVRDGWPDWPTWLASLRAFAAAGAIVAFSWASALWSAHPLATVSTAAQATAWLVCCALGATAMLSEPRRNAFHMAEGFWLGLLAGLLYLLVEISTNQAIKIFLYNLLHVPKEWLRPHNYFTWSAGKIVKISEADLTRNIAPITLLMWSALSCLRLTSPKQAWRAWSIGLYAIVAVVIMMSVHETSKVALLASTAIFLLALKNPKWSAGTLRVSWIAACLFVVPAVLGLYRFDLHNAAWVQQTLQLRIVIWKHTADMAMTSPVYGVGAGAMYVMEQTDEQQRAPGENYPGVSPHAHNVYLQMWLELGAIGAALLTLFGLALIERMQALPQFDRPYAHATFTASMTMAAASYGTWQAWFMAMFGLTVICFALALRTHKVAPGDA